MGAEEISFLTQLECEKILLHDKRQLNAKLQLL